MKIVYSDDDIVVIEKPAGIQSESARDSSGVPDILFHELGCTVYPVHRLDAATTGLMVYAKTEKAAAKLSREISEGRFFKEYHACVHGKPEPESGELNDLLYHDRTKNKSYTVKRERRGVRRASLEYCTQKVTKTPSGVVSVVKIHLKTGRTHQIRVQFASRGMPVVGDRRYGANDGEKDLKLFSTHLAFSHPSTGEKMEFFADFDMD